MAILLMGKFLIYDNRKFHSFPSQYGNYLSTYLEESNFLSNLDEGAAPTPLIVRVV